jgi:hypothetical protein
MASSSEAFEKFFTWKNSKTLLKVTVITEGQTDDVLTGWRIFGVDPDASQIGISNPSIMHSASVFDVEGATFSIESARLVATRNESDWIVFEELF